MTCADRFCRCLRPSGGLVRCTPYLLTEWCTAANWRSVPQADSCSATSCFNGVGGTRAEMRHGELGQARGSPTERGVSERFRQPYPACGTSSQLDSFSLPGALFPR